MVFGFRIEAGVPGGATKTLTYVALQPQLVNGVSHNDSREDLAILAAAELHHVTTVRLRHYHRASRSTTPDDKQGGVCERRSCIPSRELANGNKS
jgi:hypothetical protein